MKGFCIFGLHRLDHRPTLESGHVHVFQRVVDVQIDEISATYARPKLGRGDPDFAEEVIVADDVGRLVLPPLVQNLPLRVVPHGLEEPC